MTQHFPRVSAEHLPFGVTSCLAMPEDECIAASAPVQKRDDTESEKAQPMFRSRCQGEWKHLHALTSPSANSFVECPSKMIDTPSALKPSTPVTTFLSIEKGSVQ